MTFLWLAADGPLIVVFGWTPSDKTFWIRALDRTLFTKRYKLAQCAYKVDYGMYNGLTGRTKYAKIIKRISNY